MRNEIFLILLLFIQFQWVKYLRSVNQIYFQPWTWDLEAKNVFKISLLSIRVYVLPQPWSFCLIMTVLQGTNIENLLVDTLLEYIIAYQYTLIVCNFWKGSRTNNVFYIVLKNIYYHSVIGFWSHFILGQFVSFIIWLWYSYSFQKYPGEVYNSMFMLQTVY